MFKNVVAQFIGQMLTCFPGILNPPYGGVELPLEKGDLIYLAPPLEKGDLEGFLYEVMRDTINKSLCLKELPQLKFIRAL